MFDLSKMYVKQDLRFFVYVYTEWLFSFISLSKSNTQNDKGSFNAGTKTGSSNTFTLILFRWDMFFKTIVLKQSIKKVTLYSKVALYSQRHKIPWLWYTTHLQYWCFFHICSCSNCCALCDDDDDDDDDELFLWLGWPTKDV